MRGNVGTSGRNGRPPGTKSEARRVTVLNVNVPGRSSTVDADKYEAMKQALLAVLPRRAPGLTQAAMGEAVVPRLPQSLFPGGAKAMWWMKTVQLDLEARGEILRDTTSRPLTWRRSAKLATRFWKHAAR